MANELREIAEQLVQETLQRDHFTTNEMVERAMRLAIEATTEYLTDDYVLGPNELVKIAARMVELLKAEAKHDR